MKDPSILMQTPVTGPPSRTGVRRPVVERIAGWSARHRALALVGWLFLVAGEGWAGKREVTVKRDSIGRPISAA